MKCLLHRLPFQRFTGRSLYSQKDDACFGPSECTDVLQENGFDDVVASLSFGEAVFIGENGLCTLCSGHTLIETALVFLGLFVV